MRDESQAPCVQGPIPLSKKLAMAVHAEITRANRSRDPESENVGWVALPVARFENFKKDDDLCFHPDGYNQPLRARVVRVDADTMEVAFPMFELYGYLVWALFDESENVQHGGAGIN